MRLNHKSFGEGIPVIILHGLFGSLDNWQTFARRLSSEFKVYTIDLRNHGKSPHSNEHSYLAMCDDLLEFLDEHRISRTHIIGHSMGGKVAMQFAIEHAERILKMIIVDISPRSYESGHDAIFTALLEIDLTRFTKREEADKMLAQRIPDVAVRQFLLKNINRNIDGSFSWKINLQGLWKNYRNINVSVQSDSQVNIPTIVIRGGESGSVHDEDLNSFKEIFPGTRLITIQKSGHWVHAEAPDEFYNSVIQELHATE